MKETQATNTIRGKTQAQTVDSMALGRDCGEVMCFIVSSIELKVDFKLMLAAAVHGRIGRTRRAPSAQSMFASFLSAGQLMCLRLDARGARPVEPIQTRAARTHLSRSDGQSDARGARPVHNKCLLRSYLLSN